MEVNKGLKDETCHKLSVNHLLAFTMHGVVVALLPSLTSRKDNCGVVYMNASNRRYRGR